MIILYLETAKAQKHNPRGKVIKQTKGPADLLTCTKSSQTWTTAKDETAH